MTKRVYRRRRKKKRRKNRWPLLIAALLILVAGALAGSVLLGYNPLLERQLKARFGDDFFSDFGALLPIGQGEDLEGIIASYEPAFQGLEEIALERLDSLYAAALADYRHRERKGSLDRFRLTNEYIQAGRILERNVDEKFNDLLAMMKAELKDQGYSTAAADEIRDTYERAKAEKKRQLLDRLRQEVGG